MQLLKHNSFLHSNLKSVKTLLRSLLFCLSVLTLWFVFSHLRMDLPFGSCCFALYLSTLQEFWSGTKTLAC